MSRSYEVDLCIGLDKIGFMLYCFEDDEVIWEQYFTNSDTAHEVGHKYLDGAFIEGFYSTVN